MYILIIYSIIKYRLLLCNRVLNFETNNIYIYIYMKYHPVKIFRMYKWLSDSMLTCYHFGTKINCFNNVRKTALTILHTGNQQASSIVGEKSSHKVIVVHDFQQTRCTDLHISVTRDRTLITASSRFEHR